MCQSTFRLLYFNSKHKNTDKDKCNGPLYEPSVGTSAGLSANPNLTVQQDTCKIYEIFLFDRSQGTIEQVLFLINTAAKINY